MLSTQETAHLGFQRAEPVQPTLEKYRLRRLARENKVVTQIDYRRMLRRRLTSAILRSASRSAATAGGTPSDCARSRICLVVS